MPPPPASHFESALSALRQGFRADNDPTACAIDIVIPAADHGAFLAACMHAQSVHEDGEHDQAWRVLMEAYGAAKYAEGRESGRCESQTATMSKNGTLGGKATSRNRRMNMERLAARVAEMSSHGDTWEDALALEATLKRVGSECGISMTPANIAKALKMPQVAAIAAAIAGDYRLVE